MFMPEARPPSWPISGVANIAAGGKLITQKPLHMNGQPNEL
jgi:hypothetical protein